MKKALPFFFAVLLWCFASAQHTLNFNIPECPSVGLETQRDILPSISLYPNPAHNILYVTSNAEMICESVEVYDVYGRKTRLFNGDMALSTSLKLDVSGMPRGVYILNLRTNSTNYQKQFIIF